MRAALSSWKEIAAYMGKGVRTVQRWERQFGLPVRRPNAKSHVLFAIPQELDGWVKSHALSNQRSAAVSSIKRTQERQELLERLRAAYARLERTEQALRRSMDRLLRGVELPWEPQRLRRS